MDVDKSKIQVLFGQHQMNAGDVAYFDLDSARSIAQNFVNPQAQNAKNVHVTPEQDSAYMDAVKRGDMETARRMVREAAENAGYVKDSSYQGT